MRLSRMLPAVLSLCVSVAAATSRSGMTVSTFGVVQVLVTSRGIDHPDSGLTATIGFDSRKSGVEARVRSGHC
jgi:hypothetical protein